MLYIIGLGLGDEKDITIKGLEAVNLCSKLFLEHYTAILGVDLETLETFYGKKIALADRELVESNSDIILKDAKEENVALLVVGDPFCATTHTDLYLRAVKQGIKVSIIHNASIMNAIGCCGLQLYNFGQTVSIPLFHENWKPATNLKAGFHTLCLLDIKVKEPNIELLETRGKVVYDPPRYMSASEAAKQLLYIEEEVRKEKVLTRDSLCVAVARIGQDDQKIVSCSLGQLTQVELGKPLHSLIICGKVHPLEEETSSATKALGSDFEQGDVALLYRSVLQLKLESSNSVRAFPSYASIL